MDGQQQQTDSSAGDATNFRPVEGQGCNPHRTSWPQTPKKIIDNRRSMGMSINYDSAGLSSPMMKSSPMVGNLTSRCGILDSQVIPSGPRYFIEMSPPQTPDFPFPGSNPNLNSPLIHASETSPLSFFNAKITDSTIPHTQIPSPLCTPEGLRGYSGPSGYPSSELMDIYRDPMFNQGNNEPFPNHLKYSPANLVASLRSPEAETQFWQPSAGRAAINMTVETPVLKLITPTSQLNGPVSGFQSGSHSNSQFNPQLGNIPITASFGNSSTFDQEPNRDKQPLTSSSPSSDKHIKCPECRSKFTAKSNLIRHKNEQHRQQKKRYYCFRCHKDFSRKYYQLEHEENVCPLRPHT